MNSNQVTVIYKWTANPEKLDELVAIYRSVLEGMHTDEPGALAVHCHVSKEENALYVRDDFKDADALGFHQNAMGAVNGPFDAFLTLRGVKTLGVRMDRHCDNAEAVVDLLLDHPSVETVFYPGIAGHRGHEVAARQMARFGAMVSFTVRGGARAAERVCTRTRLFTLAESLGGVESLIEVPGQMTHASVHGSPLEVPDNLVRLSVGIESVNDLLDDVRWAIRE